MSTNKVVQIKTAAGDELIASRIPQLFGWFRKTVKLDTPIQMKLIGLNNGQSAIAYQRWNPYGGNVINLNKAQIQLMNEPRETVTHFYRTVITSSAVTKFDTELDNILRPPAPKDAAEQIVNTAMVEATKGAIYASLLQSWVPSGNTAPS